MDQLTVLIISDNAEFSRTVTSRWQSERNMPAFTLMGGDVCNGFDPETFHLAIAGCLRLQVLSAVLETLEAAGKRVLFVSDDAHTLQTVRNRWPGILVVRQRENWLDTLMLVASEALQRADAVARARRAEQANALLARQATLGRYMLEMRHTLNNALTSVLGNSELMLLEPGTHSAGERLQIETIRNMALRMHEILQRFSSLENELCVVERQAAKEGRTQAHAATSAN